MKKKLLMNMPVCFLIFLLAFKPHGIVYFFPTLDTLWKAILIVAALFITIIYFADNKIDKFLIYNVIYLGFIIFVTFINSADLEFCFSKLLPSWIMLVYSIMFIKDNPTKFLKCLSFFSVMMSILNLISIFMYPNGIGKVDYYFLGLDNMASMNLIFGGVFIWLYRYLTKKNKFVTLLLLLIPLYQLYYVDCSTGKVGVTLLVMLYLIFDLIKNIKWLNYKNFLLLSLVLFFGIVVFRLQNYFQFLIVDILHRDLTFTLRTFIWDEVLVSIKNNLFVGIGFLYSHAHSNYLDILYKYGIVGFLIYLINMNIINKRLNLAEQKKEKGNYAAKIVSLGFFVYFMMTIVEVYLDSQFFYVMLVLAYYSNYLSNIKMEVTHERLV